MIPSWLACTHTHTHTHTNTHTNLLLIAKGFLQESSFCARVAFQFTKMDDNTTMLPCTYLVFSVHNFRPSLETIPLHPQDGRWSLFHFLFAVFSPIPVSLVLLAIAADHWDAYEVTVGGAHFPLPVLILLLGTQAQNLTLYSITFTKVILCQFLFYVCSSSSL